MTTDVVESGERPADESSTGRLHGRALRDRRDAATALDPFDPDLGQGTASAPGTNEGNAEVNDAE